MRQNVKKQTVRLTAEEYTKLKSLAKEAGVSMEALIRKLKSMMLPYWCSKHLLW